MSAPSMGRADKNAIFGRCELIQQSLKVVIPLPGEDRELDALALKASIESRAGFKEARVY
jgi:hypothetical protein